MTNKLTGLAWAADNLTTAQQEVCGTDSTSAQLTITAEDKLDVEIVVADELWPR